MWRPFRLLAWWTCSWWRSAVHTEQHCCWAQLTINSGCRSEVRAHIRTEPLTLCREHFLWQSTCCSHWEVSHQGSKVRTGVRIRLISFSCTDSENCRPSLWRDSIFTLQTRIMSFMWPFTDWWPNHVPLQPWTLVGNSPSALWEQNRWEGSAHVNVCCSQLFPTTEDQTHLSST